MKSYSDYEREYAELMAEAEAQPEKTYIIKRELFVGVNFLNDHGIDPWKPEAAEQLKTVLTEYPIEERRLFLRAIERCLFIVQ